MKDKIKPTKKIDDDTSMFQVDSTMFTQCSICRATYMKNMALEHKCNTGWHSCVICGKDMNKKEKKISINGEDYFSMRFKKSFKLWDKIICWNCVFSLVKMFKNDTKV